MASKWGLSGSYFEACNCDVACPCVFTSAPTEGKCTVLLAWHINKGKYGDVALDGLNVVLAAFAPGHMLQVKWDIALIPGRESHTATTRSPNNDLRWKGRRRTSSLGA